MFALNKSTQWFSKRVWEAAEVAAVKKLEAARRKTAEALDAYRAHDAFTRLTSSRRSIARESSSRRMRVRSIVRLEG